MVPERACEDVSRIVKMKVFGENVGRSAKVVRLHFAGVEGIEVDGDDIRLVISFSDLEDVPPCIFHFGDRLFANPWNKDFFFQAVVQQCVVNEGLATGAHVPTHRQVRVACNGKRLLDAAPMFGQFGHQQRILQTIDGQSCAITGQKAGDDFAVMKVGFGLVQVFLGQFVQFHGRFFVNLAAFPDERVEPKAAGNRAGLFGELTALE